MKLVTKLENAFSPDHVANSINECKYDPEEGLPFEAYCGSFEQTFEKEC